MHAGEERLRVRTPSDPFDEGAPPFPRTREKTHTFSFAAAATMSATRRPAQRYLEYTPGAVPAGGAAVLSRSNASPVVGDSKEAAGRAFHHKVLIKLGLAQPGAWRAAWVACAGVRACRACVGRGAGRRLPATLGR